MKLPHRIVIERMESWVTEEDGPPFPISWDCSGYQRREPCFEEATFFVTGRGGRIWLKLCNACGIKFAARYSMHLPGTKPGDRVEEPRKMARQGI